MAAPYNMAWLRLRHSENVTAKLAITGRRFSGEELAELGVAYESVDDDAVLTRACELAEELAAYPAGAPAKIKALMRAYNDTPADEWFDRVTSLARGPRVKPKAVKN
ncbi:MAG: enoyl-CoA hydratase/isomerase family protein, partial [Gammaproteobacteria bacterium]|nr:enoyl-CoA hydratase/isomerase family protein [Gammaproteobacteria bacterium]